MDAGWQFCSFTIGMTGIQSGDVCFGNFGFIGKFHFQVFDGRLAIPIE